MSNVGIARGRLFFGFVIFIAAIAAWAVSSFMSPHGTGNGDSGGVNPVVVSFMRHGAIGTLLLSALAAYLLFPLRRPTKPVRDRLVGGMLAIMAASSLYQLVWLAFFLKR